MTMLRCVYEGEGSYSSLELGLMQEGCVVVGSQDFVGQYVPAAFFDISPVKDWGLGRFISLGDKIYVIPCLYEFKERLGIYSQDMSLFRIVSDKVRPVEQVDVCCVRAILRRLSKVGYLRNISEIVAEALKVDLPFTMPILETTSEEKSEALQKYPEKYIVVCGTSNNKGRNWKALPSYVRNNVGLPVIKVTKRDPSLFPMIEGAELVVSVNTSTIPMAGALQVPGLAVSSETVKDTISGGSMKYRIDPFLEWEVLESVSPKFVVDSINSLMSRQRLRCWCGANSDRKFVSENLRLIKCEACGTIRQDVKLSQTGLDEFYSSKYDLWRKVVEEESSYSSRLEHDLEVARKRVYQWGPLSGASWLDVGSGNGALVKVLKSNGWKAVGLEVSEVGYPAIRHGDSAGFFDVVSYIDSLEHFIDPLAELRRALSYLAAAGILIIELPNAFENPVHFRRLQHVWFFDEMSFEKMIEELNLMVMVKFKPIPGKFTYLLRRF